MNANEITAGLNKEQREAVLKTEGPVLILAGAGSGKTRVLVHRIAYLVNVMDVMPSQILAITFTNKAADEMRNRVDNIIGFGAGQIWVMTFHSCCVRILRRHAELLGYTRYFTIYDTDDTLQIMKDIFRRRNVDTKRVKERAVLNAISSAKNEHISPAQFAKLNSNDYWGGLVSDFYEEYQKQLRENNAMDFDDLLVNAVELFDKHPDILELYQERFHYLMVDEYQDTNTVQFEFVSRLAGRHRNLCVVGDDDQSIYRFRGANIRNILNFEQIFPDAAVIRLEQNYRSTSNILDAANEVIRNNRGRKSKKLWTENGEGAKVRFRRFDTGFEEADNIVAEIGRMVRNGDRNYKDFAVLYRTNAQSRLFEEKCLFLNIPYKLVGGVNFYGRREIKDVLAYLKTVDNAVDSLASMRIVNVPKRGIGQTTVNKISAYAQDAGMSFFDAALEAERIPGLSKATAKKIGTFTGFIRELREEALHQTVSELVKTVVVDSGYKEALDAEDTDESKERLQNIDELISKAVQYETNAEHPTLSGFLEEVALIADIDTVEDGDDRVLLMTLHAAKGLEFPVVYMAGMEEGLFPSSMSLYSDDSEEEIEEERRLCYVGITRAKELLTLTCANARMVRGQVEPHPVSRFVREIDREKLDQGRKNPVKSSIGSLKGGFGKDMRDAINAKAFAPKPDVKPYSNPYISHSSRYDTNSHVKSGSGTERRSSGGNAYSDGTLIRTGSSSGIESVSDGILGYEVGDRVSHKKFGVGTVKAIREGGRDYEVTVDFPAWGIKKMFAAFAKLQKVE